MKLVEIKEVRVGQIWKRKENVPAKYWVIKEINVNKVYDNLNNKEVSLFKKGSYESNYYSEELDYLYCDCLSFYKNLELTGFLGITHKIKDNKLVEIPREEFEADDIIKEYWRESLTPDCGVGATIGDERLLILTKKDLNIFCLNNCLDMTEIVKVDKSEIDCAGWDGGFIKIGVLGVNYEFVNEKNK